MSFRDSPYRRAWHLRAATYGWAGLVLHLLWVVALLVWLSNPALEEPLIRWVEAHRSPGQGAPTYIIAYEYIIDALLAVLAAGLVCNVLALLCWYFLEPPRRRAPDEVDRCPACGYDLRGSAGDCPECGTARPPA